MNDDRMDPRFADSLRGALLEEVRATPRESRPGGRITALAPRRRVEVVVAGVIAVAAVAAIVFGAVTAVRLTSAPQPASPEPLLGGRCATLASDADVSDLVAAPVTARARGALIDDKKSISVAVLGGTSCAWVADTGDAGLSVTLVPADVRTADSRDLACFDSGGSGDPHEWTCRIDVTAGGRWITGFLTTRPGTAKRETLAAVDRFDAIARDLPAEPARAAERTTGWWRGQDCEVLGERTRLDRVLDVTHLSFGGANGGMEAAGTMAALAPSGTTWCALTYDQPNDGQMMIDVWGFGGAADVVAPVVGAKGVTRLDDIDGAAVYRVGTGDSPVLWIVDGPNVLLLQPQGEDEARTLPRMLAMIPPLLTDLNEHSRP